MGITDFTGWHLASGDGEGKYELREVVGQYVSDGRFYLIARHPETKSCEFVEVDSWMDGDLFAPPDRSAAELRVETVNSETMTEAA